MELPTKKYQIIYADPPWGYKSNGAPAKDRPSLKRGERPHSVNHYYETLTPKEISDFKISEICEKNSVLFMWATTPLLPEVFLVVSAWGFKYKTMLTWHKGRCKGMGYWFRGHTEHLIFAVKGKVKAFRSLQHNIIKADVEVHSKKPDIFRDIQTWSRPNKMMMSYDVILPTMIRMLHEKINIC